MNELMRLFTPTVVFNTLPDPVVIEIPSYPADAVLPTEFKDIWSESELRTFCNDKFTKIVSPKPVGSLVARLPENYCKELLYHVRFGHERSAGRLPIYLGETLCSALQALPDIVLAANMARTIFTRTSNTIDPSIKAEARNWLLLARQLEFTAMTILKNRPEARIVTAKSTATWGDEEFSETDVTYYIDKTKLEESGLSAEEALANFKELEGI